MFFFTLLTHNRCPLFAQEKARNMLRHAFVQTQKDRPFEITAIVLFPEHLHCIWTLPHSDSEYSVRWSHIKRCFTQTWLEAEGQGYDVSASRQARRERGVWQRRFWEHTIRDHTDFVRHMDYIHYNPVKHSLANCPHAWPYSSFHRWCTEGVYDGDWCCRCDGREQVSLDLDVDTVGNREFLCDSVGGAHPTWDAPSRKNL